MWMERVGVKFQKFSFNTHEILFVTRIEIICIGYGIYLECWKNL